ncbi:MAG: hypothetical protein AB7I18_01530 [Candidatus Berkiella sp.]
MKAALLMMAIVIPQIGFAAGAWIPSHTNPDGTYVPGHFEGNTDGTVVVPVDGYPAGDGQRHIVPSEARNYLPHNGEAGTGNASEGAFNRDNALEGRGDRGTGARGHRR